MLQPVSVMIVADHRLFGECLASLLARHESLLVLAVMQTAEEALRQLRERLADVILIDVHLPQTMALTLTQQLTHDFPHVRVLLLGVTEAEAEIQAYVEAGASGYVSKDAPFHELISAIELVARGETLCSPHIAHAMFARLAALAGAAERGALRESMILSNRELEILQLIAEGRSNRQIADHLCLSPYTVKNHVHNILKKLQVNRRLEAIQFAAERRWLKTAAHMSDGRTLPLPPLRH